LSSGNGEEIGRVFVHTDGACLGNPGPGGYAAIMKRGDDGRVMRGGDPETTNNRMELMGPIMALESMLTAAPVTIHSDSQYVVKGMTKWIHGWKVKGWKNSKKQAVANRDLWERLDAVVSTRLNGVEWIWVKGHAGDPQNEMADRIANEEALKASKRVVG